MALLLYESLSLNLNYSMLHVSQIILIIAINCPFLLSGQPSTYALAFDNGTGLNDRAWGISVDSAGIDLITISTCILGEVGACCGPTRINNHGDIVYTKQYKYNLMGHRSATPTPNGGLLLPGQYQKPEEPFTATLTKLDAEGNLVFSRKYLENDLHSIGTSAYIYNDSMYILQGTVLLDDTEGTREFIIVTDTFGKVITENIYPYKFPNIKGSGMAPLSTGEWLVHFRAWPTNGINEVLVLSKLNTNLDKIWSKTYHLTNSFQPIKIFELPENKYLLTSTVDPSDSSITSPYEWGNISLHILDTTGTVIELNHVYQNLDIAHLHIISDGKGNFIGGGERAVDVYGDGKYSRKPWLVKFNEKGNIFWEYQFVWTSTQPSFWIEDLDVFSDGRIAFCGYVEQELNSIGDSYVVVVDSDGCLSQDKNCSELVQFIDPTTFIKNIPEQSLKLKIWPNPSQDKIYVTWDIPSVVTYRLYDFSGYCCIEIKSPPGSPTTVLQTEYFPSGLYTLSATSEQGYTHQELIIIAK